ncbi:MAG: hypothetical protein E6J20_05660 [Chloroflexi bacterium]|nr:MAG: hypothetical protein E6J20_05660 [Chloroflexota bacterium]
MRGAALGLAMLVAMACNGPGSGPSLPSGAHWIHYALVSSAGPVSRTQGVLAATSLSTIRAQAISATSTTSAVTPWPDAGQKSGVLYVAVVTHYECTRPTEDKMAANGPALFYVHWIGHSSGVCNAAMAVPSYRLYEVQVDQLPRSGNVDLKLLVEDAADGTKMVIAEAAVQLS